MFACHAYADNGNDRTSVKIGMFGVGVRWLQTPSLNDALTRQRLAKLGTVVYTPLVLKNKKCTYERQDSRHWRR
jgi:hypothetical protein